MVKKKDYSQKEKRRKGAKKQKNRGEAGIARKIRRSVKKARKYDTGNNLIR